MNARSISLVCLLAGVLALGWSGWTWARSAPATASTPPATAQPEGVSEGGAPVATATPAGLTGLPVPGQTPGAQQDEVKPVPAQLPEVLARVNGEEIKKVDLEHAVRNLEGRVGQPVPPDRRDEVFRGVLDQLIGYRLLVQESKTRNVSVTDAELEERVAEIHKQFPNEEAFQQALKTQAKSVDDLRRESREGLVVEKLLKGEIDPKIKVPAEEVEAFYSQNPDRFKQPESVRASHILVKAEASESPEAKATAKAEAEKLLGQLKGGADFAALAKEHSADPGSGQQGGDLGFFGRGQMVPEFEQAAFTLKPGELSGLVQSQFGFHIIKVAEHRAERTVPLAEVGPRITEFLTQRHQQQLTGEFVQALRAKGKVDVLM